MEQSNNCDAVEFFNKKAEALAWLAILGDEFPRYREGLSIELQPGGVWTLFYTAPQGQSPTQPAAAMHQFLLCDPLPMEITETLPANLKDKRRAVQFAPKQFHISAGQWFLVDPNEYGDVVIRANSLTLNARRDAEALSLYSTAVRRLAAIARVWEAQNQL